MTKHSNKADGRPALQWYPSDPLNDVGLKLCSLGAQGLWYNMLWYMFFSPERGVLLEPNGHKIGASELAGLTGKPEAEVKQYLSELERRSVYSKTREGAIYNRRQVRDEKHRRSKVEAGRKGGSIAKTEAEVQAESKQSRGSSSSSSTSSSASTLKNNGLWVVPKQLSGLTLYESDQKFCNKLPEILPLWKEAYPYLNIDQEIKKAHVWEISNPKRRKKDRVRFITATWLPKADEKRSKRPDQSGETMDERLKRFKESTK